MSKSNTPDPKKTDRSKQPTADTSGQFAESAEQPPAQPTTLAENSSVEPKGSKGSVPSTADDVAASPVPDVPTNAGNIDTSTAASEIVTAASSTSTVNQLLEVLKVALIPISIIAAFAIGIALIGVAQKQGWLASASSGDAGQAGVADGGGATAASYICPMMCVPPTGQPGRCPVCAMELVPAASSIAIDPRSRRISGIATTKAVSKTLVREVRGVGEISYDESKLKTLTAYIDGRVEELFADYTGIAVSKGDKLAILYSPDLYSAQSEFTSMLDFANESSSNNPRIVESNQVMLANSRTRLIEMGLTEQQVATLESTKKPQYRIGLHAPMSGTVIEMMVKTGQTVKAGTPVYKLADLTSVWLVLELFPEDARQIKIGQVVTATTQSGANEVHEGIVEFVEPNVDPKMRTVGVRVSIKNPNGYLKPGEFARATLKIPLLSQSGQAQPTVVVPRDSLLSVGQTSLVYVEGKPGEFEIRHVKTGPTVDGMIAIYEGVAAGENVVSKSTFMLDAHMQLQGQPSLIDPDKAVADEADATQLTEAQREEIREAMAALSAEDRKQAEAQELCPVSGVRLGSNGMGVPVKIEVEGRSVFICCEGCRDPWVNEPDKHFEILEKHHAAKSKLPELTDAESDEIRNAMSGLSEQDRELAKAQIICPVSGVRLGAKGMGVPVKIEVEGRSVFICCEGCRDPWVNEPDKYFKILDDFLVAYNSNPSAASSNEDAGAATMERPND